MAESQILDSELFSKRLVILNPINLWFEEPVEIKVLENVIDQVTRIEFLAVKIGNVNRYLIAD